ncbi:hypothetical protein LJR045_002161 [Microbacterium sp. LjRoot45]|uniref:hypothetical protein n=1 Tax=Microbacterium sp. LjRoot45 TaxID=3342329 RepID=UPI003ECF48EA
MGRGSELAVVELIRRFVSIPAESASTLDHVAVRLRPYSSNPDDTWRCVDLDRHDETSETHATTPLVADVCLSDSTYAALFDWGGGDLVLQLDSARPQETAESAARRILAEIAAGSAAVEWAKPG